MLTTPLPFSSVRSKSSVSKLRSPKKSSAPWFSNSTILRKIALVEEEATRPYSASNSFFPSSVAYWSTFLRSLRSSNGYWWSSQYLKITASTPSCTSERSKMRESNTEPNSETVARKRTPSCLEIVSNSTGKASGV